jgi:putative colanic acid biosynthesis UDP-glucose lipid carrier transferase
MLGDNAFVAISKPERLTARKGPLVRHLVDNKKKFFAAKRVLDILIALVALVLVLSWLLPLLAILIKLNSKGPVFFLQKRVGLGGKTFICYKLRTMPGNKVRHMQSANHDDDGITGLGQFLRQSNLDELPQFFNVLAGTMSVVGPRPHTHADCHAFAQVIPQYKFRNLVKPGITGLAQVKGYHGKITGTACIIKRYEYDDYYVRNAGFALDMNIIFTTAIQRLRFLVGARGCHRVSHP